MKHLVLSSRSFMKTKKAFFATTILILAMLACQTPSLPVAEAENPSTTDQTIPTVLPANIDVTNPTTQQETLVAIYENVSRGTVAIFTDLGSGSGFVFDSNGHIVTNYHVVEGSNAVEVRFTSGYMVYGTVV